MKRNIIKTVMFPLLWVGLFVAFFAGCEKDSDGPMAVSKDPFVFDGEGFFLMSKLDSGEIFHMVGDTLYLNLDSMWTFSICALQSVDLSFEKRDSVLWISPILKIHATEEDCAAPYHHPDTTLKLVLDDNLMEGIGQIKIKNDQDSVLDSILLRRGKMSVDTFVIYMDSSFDTASKYPLRTKDKKGGKVIPTMFRVLDSLKPRTFYWRTMKSVCSYVIDDCGNKIADTIYPRTWNINDTNLVPIHYVCADSDSVYCVNRKWVDDSTSLGKLQERPDTIWYFSTYFAEKIPKCASYNSFSVSNYGIGKSVRFIRELLTVNEKETACGPASKEDWMVYNLSGNSMVVDTDSITVVDSLYKIWKEAKVAPDTLIQKND